MVHRGRFRRGDDAQVTTGEGEPGRLGSRIRQRRAVAPYVTLLVPAYWSPLGISSSFSTCRSYDLSPVQRASTPSAASSRLRLGYWLGMPDFFRKLGLDPQASGLAIDGRHGPSGTRGRHDLSSTPT